MNKETFYEELKKINITLTNEQKENIEKYADLLIEYNKHTNITAIKDKEGIYSLLVVIVNTGFYNWIYIVVWRQIY